MSSILELVQKYNFDQLARTEDGNALLYCSPEDYRELRTLAARLADEQAKRDEYQRRAHDAEARLAEVIENSARDHTRWATERLNREARLAEAERLLREAQPVAVALLEVVKDASQYLPKNAPVDMVAATKATDGLIAFAGKVDALLNRTSDSADDAPEKCLDCGKTIDLCGCAL